MKWMVVSALERVPQNPRLPRTAVVEADNLAPTDNGDLVFETGGRITAVFAKGSFHTAEIANDAATDGAGFYWTDRTI